MEGESYRMTIPATFKLINLDPEVVLTKTGAGNLRLNAQTQGFTGTLRLEAGRISLDSPTTTPVLHAGAFVWDAGALSLTLTPAPAPSNRLQIAGSLTKTAGLPSGRSLRLLANSESVAATPHTLATYAATDLTLDDFTATHSGLPAGYSAEFTVGPAALTVAFAPETAYTAWRLATLASANNLGPAHDLADPDSDGRPNLLEYAVGSAPLSPDAQPLALLARDPVSQRLSLTFSRIADPALTYSVLAAPSPAGPWTEVVFTSTGPDNTPGPVTVTDSASLSAHPHRFLRLTVSR